MIGKDARAIANYILDEADHIGIVVTNLSLQKILYFAHGWYLTNNKRPLLKQSFEAWEHGPVIRDVYSAFKSHGSNRIRKTRASRFDIQQLKSTQADDVLSEENRIFLRGILEYYGRIDAFKLSHMTHVKEGPWDLVWSQKSKPNIKMIITDESIYDYFSKAQSVEFIH